MEVTIAISFLLERYFIVVNFIRRLMLTRNGSLLMNMVYVDTSSSLRDSRISLGISFLVRNNASRLAPYWFAF